ncbi:ATP-binding protein [Kitasatospora sp. McL0602]|uniref:ATP-binding protein n=1 Tax=Kitasatospora sp. McL0602 TaxID=3439530 RepID=UPI003F8BC6B0
MIGFDSTTSPVDTTSGALFCWLSRHRKSAGEARELLRSFLSGRDGSERLIGGGELVVSELVANAVEHAGSPRGRLIAVRFEFVGGLLRVEVHDAATEQPVLRPVDGDAVSGRGLRLVEAVSSSWGCCPRAGGIGKFVWAVVGPVGSES